MSSTALDALQAQALGSGSEDAVTVNTRVLIDKVLARYPGEWTVFRELLQNAADASATKVSIRYETLPSASTPVPQSADQSTVLKHILSNHTIRALVIENNGQVFSENDWTRLKTIAEGNPDENKIGAFGVGFYSCFAESEEPFVVSGDSAMGFFWKSNSLFTRRIKQEYNPNTVFFLKYRNTTSPLPYLLPLCQFLATSLTFVGLETIDLFVDEWNVLSLSRKAAPVEDIQFPRDIDPKTSASLMKFKSLQKGIAQLDGRWMDAVAWRSPKPAGSSTRQDTSQVGFRSFFSKLAGGNSTLEVNRSSTGRGASSNEVSRDLSQTQKMSCFLQIYTATLNSTLSSTTKQELERATKKPPPKETRLSVLISAFEGQSESSTQQHYADVFATVLPNKSGKIFIGFPTQQTTSLGCHISAPSIIPTVEREAIDLNARFVKDWNLELLRAAGIICRIAWGDQMRLIRSKIEQVGRERGKSKIREPEISGVLPGFIATAQNFTFKESTPLAKVGNVIEDSFWTCSRKASIDFLSTCGVQPTHLIRNAPKDLSFMTDIAVIPQGVLEGAAQFVERLVDYGLVTDVTPSDIKAALESTPLNPKQLTEYTAWVAKKAGRRELDSATIRSLMSVAIGNDDSDDGGSGKLIVLNDIDRFLTANKIPASMPVPPSVMPFKYTKSIPLADLNSLGWEELQIIPWTRWLLEQSGNRSLLDAQHDITTHPGFARSVLPILSKAFDSMSASSKDSLVQAIASRTTIPTKLGMRKPAEAYFPTVKLFDDLPIVHNLNGVKDRFLVALGVRKTIELGVVFDRLLAQPETSSTTTKPKWNHADLIKYLASVRDDIPKTDIEKLRETNFCVKESESLEADSNPSNSLYKISQLFEPKPALRDLGLPILQWPGIYRPGSSEDKFMIALGLRSCPTVPELVQIISSAHASSNTALHSRAMGYFLNNHHINGYASFDYSKIKTPFLPTKNSKALSIPSQCFADEGASLLGFSILDRALRAHASRFGVKDHPPIESCLETLLRSPPSSRKDAVAIFRYFAKRLGEINLGHAEKLRDARFIPIFDNDTQNEKSSRCRHVSPQQCFLSNDGDTVYKDLFDFCDFGSEANSFLLRCGSKPEPTKVELARLLVKNPRRILAVLASAEKYLNLLRSLGDNIAALKKDKALFKAMTESSCLLASRYIADSKETNSTQPVIGDELEDADEDESAGMIEWDLTNAQEAIVVDDYTIFNVFRSKVFAAPQEDGLEAFYRSLGSPLLSELVEVAARHGRPVADQRPAARLQKQIYERSKLFLYEQPQSSIKHDSRWLEKNVQVEAVSSISFRRTLKGRNISHEEKRSAVITRGNTGYTLWITAGPVDFYQVSQALVSILLSKASNQSAITLEMILKTELRELGARGINVSRILRQKAEQARLAEVKRLQELEDERKRLESEEAVWRDEQARGSATERHPSVPGGFPDSPDQANVRNSTAIANLPQHLDDHTPRTSKGLFSNLTRRLGFEDGSMGNRHLQSLLGNTPSEAAPSSPPQQSQTDESAPPPYSADDPRPPAQPAPSVATSPFQIRQNLLSAIQKSRPYQSSSLYSRGESHEVSEASSYCDERPSHDLSFTADIAQGLRLFLPKAYSDPSAFLRANSRGLSNFASVLKDVASIFSLRLDCINIFYMPDSKSIAFNRAGTIFCNFYFFEQYGHAANRGHALRYWWVTLCHEIAHNLVESHSAAHSYYIESFVEFTFEKAAKLIGAGTATTAQDGIGAKTPSLID
ncbi:MAG: hypothetical protein Q9227_009364 [Pyrenula ochraceoflavens]